MKSFKQQLDENTTFTELQKELICIEAKDYIQRIIGEFPTYIFDFTSESDDVAVQNWFNLLKNTNPPVKCVQTDAEAKQA